MGNALFAFKLLSSLWKNLLISPLIDAELFLAKEKLKGSFLFSNQSIDEILDIKSNIGKNQKIFEDKIIGLIFFNPSLRTRMSTYKASKNLGLETFFINISNNITTKIYFYKYIKSDLEKNSNLENYLLSSGFKYLIFG